MPLSWLTDFGGVMTRSVGDLADMLNVVTGTDPADPTTAPADAERPADWRSTLDPNALRGQADRLHPVGLGGPVRHDRDDRRVQGGAEVPDRRGRDDRRDGLDRGRREHAARAGGQPDRQHDAGRLDAVHRRAPGAGRAGLRHPQRGRRQLLAEEGLLRARRTPRRCAVAPGRADDAGRAHRPPRLPRCSTRPTPKTWLDTAGADDSGVDAVVYPGLLSDISLNDGGGGKASFGRRDTPGAGPGIPTVVFPAGRNDHGQPINLQLLGPGVGRRQARRDGVRLRAARRRGRQGAPGGRHGAGAEGRQPRPAGRSAGRCRRRCR